jgi:hypothetical protein
LKYKTFVVVVGVVIGKFTGPELSKNINPSSFACYIACYHSV